MNDETNFVTVPAAPGFYVLEYYCGFEDDETEEEVSGSVMRIPIIAWQWIREPKDGLCTARHRGGRRR